MMRPLGFNSPNGLGRAAITALALAAAVGLAACSRKSRIIQIDHRFSYNVVRVPEWFPPKLEEMSPAQREVLFERGAPEFLRFWWRSDGRFISSSDLSGRFHEAAEDLASLKKTWIYLRQDTEIEFTPTGGYAAHPLTDPLRLICLYGDPTDKGRPIPDRQGRLRETWTWIEHGIMVELLDGVEVRRSFFQATGQGTDLTK